MSLVGFRSVCSGRRRDKCFFFNDTATTEIYTLSLHDALPISLPGAGIGQRPAEFAEGGQVRHGGQALRAGDGDAPHLPAHHIRSEEHTSELQSRQYLVCRLLLEKKKHHTYTDGRSYLLAFSLD